MVPLGALVLLKKSTEDRSDYTNLTQRFPTLTRGIVSRIKAHTERTTLAEGFIAKKEHSKRLCY